MSIVLSVLQYGAIALATLVAAMAGYLLLLTFAALLASRRTTPRVRQPDQRFLFLVPAHNEERLLPSTLANLQELDYPKELYAVHVVADNCTDGTAALARAGGAIAHERFDAEKAGKGYALEWLLQRIWERHEPHDAMIILDADSIVSPNFLRVMDARLARGERAIQAYYAVRDPGQSWSVSLRAVALAALHFLRPMGRSVLGGSTGLKGNGMVFAADILREHRWSASLTEDIEYHMHLIVSGERVTFAPDAVVWAEMPNSLAAAQSQNVRWERGRMQMVRQYVPMLLRETIRKPSFMLLDAAIEQLIPPFSIVAALSVLSLLASLALHTYLGVALSGFAVFGIAFYTVAALVLSRAPRKVYQALLYAPVFIAWKLLLYVRVLLGFDPKGWVRTARNDA